MSRSNNGASCEESGCLGANDSARQRLRCILYNGIADLTQKIAIRCILYNEVRRKSSKRPVLQNFVVQSTTGANNRPIGADFIALFTMKRCETANMAEKSSDGDYPQRLRRNALQLQLMLRLRRNALQLQLLLRLRLLLRIQRHVTLLPHALSSAAYLPMPLSQTARRASAARPLPARRRLHAGPHPVHASAVNRTFPRAASTTPARSRRTSSARCASASLIAKRS